MTNDIDVYQGDDKKIKLTVTDESGTAIDISSYEIYFTVKKNIDDSDSDAVYSFDMGVGTDGEDGVITFWIERADTSGLDAGTYVYDIQWKDTDSKVKTLIVGDFNVKKEVTDRTSLS